MKIARLLVALSAMVLAACEQVILRGPVGDATVTVTELRSGNVANSGVTGDLDQAIAIVEGRGRQWDDISEVGKLQKLGKIAFDSPKDFEDALWYVVSVSGGFDYDPNGDQVVDGGTQVNGSLHALVKGARLNEGQVAVTPLTESAYQFVIDHVDLMSDEEIQQALDQLALELLDEDVDDTDPIDYLDVISMNTLYHNPSKLVEAQTGGLDDIAGAIADGVSNDTIRDLSRGLFSTNAPDGIPEAVYEASIADIIAARGCGPACHFPGGIGANGSNNVIVPNSDPDHVSKNTGNFVSLVEGNSVAYVLGKLSGTISHTGGPRIPVGTDDYNTFEEWLKLL